MRNAAAFVQVVNHLCKSQRNFRLTERNFQQLHHLIVAGLFTPEPVRLDDVKCIDKSFPSFLDLLARQE